MQKFNMESMLPYIEEAFSRGVDFQFPVTGVSMNPLLYQNRDFVKIVKPVLPLKVGDVPLYRRDDGHFILHRVVDIKENGEYVMCGDNQFILEHGITDKNIIGIAKTLVIDGKEIDVDTDADYLKHKDKYIKNIKYRYPLRRVHYALAYVKQRILKPLNKEQVAPPQAINQEEINKIILETGAILIEALKGQLTGAEFEFPEDTNFKKLFKVAQMHKVTSIVAPLVMKSSHADSSAKAMFSKELFMNSARYTAQEHERQQLSEQLSEAKIHHCFLKGSKISKYYKNPDSRYMLDMDVYVESEKYSEAEKILLSRGYEINSNADEKDTAFIKRPHLIIELHRELKYDYDKGYDYYKGAFKRMTSDDGYVMNMTDEDFYVYILSHTAHHFEASGTGVKSIIDHYHLRESLKPQCDAELLEKALKEIGLSAFEKKIDALCDYWFNGATPDTVTVAMAEYILLSGVFGNEVNKYINGITRGAYGENTEAYFIKRIFPPLKTMRNRYTILKKLPVLLPFCWGLRLITSLLNPKSLISETKSVVNVDNAQKQQQKQFFNDVGL